MAASCESVSVESLILRLFDIQAVKFGKFTLKSGIESPVYIDLRVIVSHPDLLREVCEILWQVAVNSKADFSLMCGVPYTALPIASCISVKENVPMVMRRKEAKAYGTKKMIEGEFEAGEKCLVIEDVVTSGSSVMETVEALAGVGLKVRLIIHPQVLSLRKGLGMGQGYHKLLQMFVNNLSTP